MKKLIIVFLLLFVATPAFGIDGMIWNTWNDDIKQSFITGIFIGRLTSCLDYRLPLSTYLRVHNCNANNYMKELDKFYSKSKYRKIKIIDAYILASIKLKDDDSNDYKYILQMCLDNRILPHRGKVIRIIDGDTIEIESIDLETSNEANLKRNKQWKVRLIGINTPEINHHKQIDKEKYGMKAKQFLSSLCLNRTVQLIYCEDIFDKYGRLLADVSLQGINLSTHLLKRGLAKPYPYHGDPKKNYKNSFLETIYNSSKKKSLEAQKKKLYIWGDKTDPYVENIIRK